MIEERDKLDGREEEPCRVFLGVCNDVGFGGCLEVDGAFVHSVVDNVCRMVMVDSSEEIANALNSTNNSTNTSEVITAKNIHITPTINLKSSCLETPMNYPLKPAHPSLIPLFKYSLSPTSSPNRFTLHSMYYPLPSSSTMHTLFRTSYFSSPLLISSIGLGNCRKNSDPGSQNGLEYNDGDTRHDVIDLRIRFLFLQMLHIFNYVHSKGGTFNCNNIAGLKNLNNQSLNPLHPENIRVDDDGWITLLLPLWQTYGWKDEEVDSQHLEDNGYTSPYPLPPLPPNDGVTSPLDLRFSNTNIDDQNDEASRRRRESCTSPLNLPGENIPPTTKWRQGMIGNFEYLMILNQACGRTLGDAAAHPVLPWVTDFSYKINDPDCLDGCWRDLTKSKFRLNKGDAQLDVTYGHESPKHHITENLSDITYYIYLARQTPIHTLRKVVRSDFVPKHYPDTLPRLYEWTPDECIPEFYTTPKILLSLHKGLNLTDIQLPDWCKSNEEFINYHRSLLEGDVVSSNLHKWIDLNFGHALTGSAAIERRMFH